MAVEFDYSKLRGRIREVYKTETKFADALGIAPTTLSSKLNNKVGFSNDEMLEICNLLSIPLSDTVDYFFANGAKKNLV